MLIGIVSDTHDNIPNLTKVLEAIKARGIETILHAGDVGAPFTAKVLAAFEGTVYAVYGNNDGEHAGLAKVIDIVEPPRTLTIAGRTIVVAHDVSQIPHESREGADLVITGHTHTPEITGEKPVMLNPGEAGGWLNGRATYAVFDLEALQGEVCDI
jgi:putative phosphoesterase